MIITLPLQDILKRLEKTPYITESILAKVFPFFFAFELFIIIIIIIIFFYTQIYDQFINIC
jgi:hypothetical protein